MIRIPSKGGMHNRQPLTPKLIWKSLCDYDLWPLYFFGLKLNIPASPPNQYLTLTLRELGFDTPSSTLLTIPAQVGTTINVSRCEYLLYAILDVSGDPLPDAPYYTSLRQDSLEGIEEPVQPDLAPPLLDITSRPSHQHEQVGHVRAHHHPTAVPQPSSDADGLVFSQLKLSSHTDSLGVSVQHVGSTSVHYWLQHLPGR